MSIISMQEVSKVYGENLNRVKAISSLNLEIEEGDFIAIVGESGSGKTTLLNLIGGLDSPTVGNVIFNKKNFRDLTTYEMCDIRRNDISVIYQSYNLIETLTVKENIILPILLDEKNVNESKLNNLLNKLNLGNRKDFYIDDLSGGQKQKVAVARALINTPKLILADEPTGNLDSLSSMEVINFLKQYNEEFNATIVMVTHNLEIANKCKRIITLKDGQIIEDRKN